MSLLDPVPESFDSGLSKKLRKASPEQLALWQKGWKEHTAEWILAEKEWERRAIIETAFWQRMSAWIGVAGAVAGSLVTILAAILAKHFGF